VNGVSAMRCSACTVHSFETGNAEGPPEEISGIMEYDMQVVFGDVHLVYRVPEHEVAGETSPTFKPCIR